MATPKTVTVTEEVHAYLIAHSLPLDDVATDLIAETEALGSVAAMQIAPEQGLFFTLFAKTMQVRNAVEVGTFTGFSSLCLARGMAAESQLVCCDIDETWTGIARRAWERAGVSDRIDLRLGPAIDTLRALPPEPYLDLAFVDADKIGYISYWDELVPRLRTGGVLLVDNVLWGGGIVDPDQNDENTTALRAFNDHAASDDRVALVMLPIADGLTLALRR